MPELPEVETTRRGIAPYLIGHHIAAIKLRCTKLRWPIPAEINQHLTGQRIDAVQRRGKYLLLHTKAGSALLHLGMSGCLRILPDTTPAGTHDHVDFILTGSHLKEYHLLRFTDPRRFGCLLWQPVGTTHRLLERMGPEPLTDAFNGNQLWRLSRCRQTSVKQFLMNHAVVVGIGNIYANEILFAAGVDPRRAAYRISRMSYTKVASQAKRILNYAIERGGTTLRDFLSPDGKAGYFFRELMVYGRAGNPCKYCGTTIRETHLGQRSTFWCPRCQH